MSEKVIVLGTGGHAKVVIEMLRASGYEVPYCIGASAAPQPCMGVEVLAGDDHIERLSHVGHRLAFPAVGANDVRERLARRAIDAGYELVNAISPHAMISPSAVLGRGVAIMAGAIINAEAKIADLVIINTGATIDHDCRIGAGAHVAPQCALAGNVVVGPCVFLGIGTVVIPRISIGHHAMVGAGSVVVRDIPASAKVLGHPARQIDKESTSK